MGAKSNTIRIQVESTRVESSQVESSHVKSSQVESSQVKLSQIKSSQVKLSRLNYIIFDLIPTQMVWPNTQIHDNHCQVHLGWGHGREMTSTQSWTPW